VFRLRIGLWLLLLALLVGGSNYQDLGQGGGNNNNNRPGKGDKKRRLKRPHRADRDDEAPEGDQCVYVNRKTEEQCPYDGFPELVHFCVSHFKTYVMEPLRCEGSMERFHRAKDALARFFRRLKRARDERIAQEQVELLRDRGVDREQMEFADPLSDSSDVERDLPRRPVSTLVPSRDDMDERDDEMHDNNTEHVDGDEQDENDIDIMGEDAGVAEAQRGSPAASSIQSPLLASSRLRRRHDQDPAAVAAAPAPAPAPRAQAPAPAPAPTRLTKRSTDRTRPAAATGANQLRKLHVLRQPPVPMPPSPVTPPMSPRSVAPLPPMTVPCLHCSTQTPAIITNACSTCGQIVCQGCQDQHLALHQAPPPLPPQLPLPPQSVQQPVQPVHQLFQHEGPRVIEVLSSSEEEDHNKRKPAKNPTTDMVNAATKSLDGLTLSAQLRPVMLPQVPPPPQPSPLANLAMATMQGVPPPQQTQQLRQLQAVDDNEEVARVEVMQSSSEEQDHLRASSNNKSVVATVSSSVSCCECPLPADQSNAFQCLHCDQIVHHRDACVNKHPCKTN
jgi:hypothetical protein